MAPFTTLTLVLMLASLTAGCAAVTSSATTTTAVAGTLRPANLRCEYHTNPAGIDITEPRLSWELEAVNPDRRGQRQTAYQILVASNEAQLAQDEGDLWDSGKIESNATNQIVYAGQPLDSRQQVWWKVRSWNEQGEPSDWSEPARWSMGLLEPGDWSAKWIGYDAPAEASEAADVTLEGAKWLWSEAPAPADAEKESRFFRHVVELPQDRTIKAARFLLTADDELELFINGAAASQATSWRQLHHVDVTPHLRAGQNVLALHVRNNANTPGGVIGRLTIDFAEGESIVVPIDETWRVATHAAEGWQQGDFDDASWAEPIAVGTMGDAPWGTVTRNELHLPPAPQLRTTFTSNKPIRRATLYATALGVYELTLNGERIGDVELAPGWTDFDKRVYYHTHDATNLVRDGENVLGTLLGDGWYAGYVGFNQRRERYGDQPRLRAQLEIEYEDGSTQTIATDGSWKAAYGPVREADLLMGWTYDARRESNWQMPGFDDSAWSPVAVGSDFDGLVQAYPGAAVRRQGEIPAASVRETKPGVYVFDLAQNMVGWARIKGIAKAGQPIVVRYAEMMEGDELYTIALRAARATDTYIPATDGPFEFEPDFTFHGFQYVEVSGLAEPPTTEAVTGVVVHADMPRTGEFESASPLVNQLFHNIIWGQKGNYLEVPTDCPQRDERLGWTGDAQFFIPTAGYNFDVAAFFTKWLVDLNQDSQRADGAYASVAPDVMDFGTAGSTGWADAGIICPYVIWQYYGDTRIIERHYDSMAKFIEYLQATSENHIRGQGSFGDWLNLGGGAKSEVIGTAYVAHVAGLMAEMAAAIGKHDDAAAYRKLADDTRAAFIEHFVTDDGRIRESSQTGYALAFTMDLLPQDLRDEAAEQFVGEIAEKDWHLATGFIGTPRLLPALTDAGQTDVAYRLFLNDTYPSWLYQVTLGATTMWERWDGWTPEKGFQDPGMNSFNHYAFGSVGEWMYDTVTGIESDGPGFRKIVIRPQPDPRLPSASASYHSINGEIISEWRLEGDQFHLRVRIPPNTTATVYVPTTDPAAVTEGGQPAAEAEGVTLIKAADGGAVFEIGSGTYDFSAPRPQSADDPK